MSTAEMIRKARKEKHITQLQLADAVGLSVMSIRRYESRNEKTRRTPTLTECQKIADVLGLQWWTLMGLEDYGSGFYGKEADESVYKRMDESYDKDWRIDEIMKAYYCLNDEGKQEAVKRIEELCELSRYRR